MAGPQDVRSSNSFVILTISHHKIGLLAHNFVLLPSLVRFKLYAIIFTQGRSRDCKLQGAACPRHQTRPFLLVNWWAYGIICKTTETRNLKVNKTESEQNSFPHLARVTPSYLSNTCHAPSTAKMRFSDSPVGRQSQKWFGGLLRVIEAGVLIFRRRQRLCPLLLTLGNGETPLHSLNFLNVVQRKWWRKLSRSMRDAIRTFRLYRPGFRLRMKASERW